jgi:gluconokinase
MNPGQNGKRMSNEAPDEPRRYVIMGVSGCGKSEIGTRLAMRLGYRHLEGDSYHPPRNIEKMAAGIALDDTDRKEWLLTLTSEIASARVSRQGLVISCSALKRKYRDLLRQGDPLLIFVHLWGDRSLIEERMRARPNHFMPVSLLDSQFRDLEPLDDSECGVQMDVRLPPDELIRRVLESTARA